jgi:hypothetical protein
MPDPKTITIGSLLVLRSEFDRVARNEERLTAVRYRAGVMVQIIDELLTYREREARNG